MTRNDSRPTTRSQVQTQRRSLWLWLSILLVVGMWSTRLAGQNATPTYQSPTAVNDSPAPNRTTALGKKVATPNTTSSRMPRPGQGAAPNVSSSRSSKLSSWAPNTTKRDSHIEPASHQEFSGPPSANAGVNAEVPAGNFVPNPLPPMTSNVRPAMPGAGVMIPAERTVPPQITGSHLGLQPGETATERSLRLMSVIADLEQQNAELADQLAKRDAELKAKDAKLQSSTSQITAARKEMALALDEFQRLRKEIADLREKFRSSEQENASLMRSLSPLLKQILQSDDEPATKE